MKRILILTSVFILTLFFTFYLYKSFFKKSTRPDNLKTTSSASFNDSGPENINNGATVPFNILSSDFSISFAKFSYDKDVNILEGEVTIKNKALLNFVDLSYKYALRIGDISSNYTLTLPITRLDLIDVENTQDTFSLATNQSKKIIFKYNLPPNLNKDKYYLEFQITNKHGRSLASNVYLFEINKQVGDGIPLSITDSYVMHNSLKRVHNSTTYYDKNEKIGTMVTKILNITNSSVHVYPTYVVYRHPNKGNPIFEVKRNSIEVKANSSYLLESEIDSISEPGVYSLMLHLYDDNNVDRSYIVDFRAVTSGEMADYQQVKSSDYSFSIPGSEFFFYLYGKSTNDGVLENATLKADLYDNEVLVEEKDVKNIKLGFSVSPIRIRYESSGLLKPIIKYSIYNANNKELFSDIIKIIK